MIRLTSGMKHFFLILCTSLLIVNSATAQETNPWLSLAMVQKESHFDEMMGMEITEAIPMIPAQKLDGTEITLNGYMIALSAKTTAESHFMFSRYPQNMCFFCGAAGPESAMQVFMKDGTKIKHSKDKVKVKGTLQIQKNDASGLIYFLLDAVLID